MKYECLYDELVDPFTLKEHTHNANKHSPEQVDRLVKILHYQGFRYPVKISKQSGMITAGHGRVMAAKKIGCQVPVNFQDYATFEMEISDVHADNAIASWAEMDLGIINNQMGEFGPDFDLDLLGIKDFKLDLIEKLEPGCDEDEVPELKETIAKLGDLFQLGEHRLLCGDSTDILQVERLMNGQKADMVFTDPPYGYKYESNHQSKHTMLENDDKILDFLPCAYAVMSANSAIYVCGSHQTITKWRPLVDDHFKYKNLIVWKKNNWSMGDLKGAFAGQHELIIFAHKGDVKIRGERSRDVWEFDRDPPKDHPTQKPVDLIEFAISKVTDANMTVLDLFGGSGSTLIACEKTNRKCFMMELDPHYVDVIIQRWQKFSNKKAYLINQDGSKTLYDELKSKNEGVF